MSRKTRILALALAAVCTLPAVATAQSLEEVLDRHYEAIGGEAAWKDVQTMRATGTLDVMSGMVTGPFEIVQKRPSMTRIDMSMQGMEIVQAFDGETAWQVMPMLYGTDEPQVADAETAAQLVEQADMDGPLVGWAEEGSQVELLGTETVDGMEAYRLKVTLANGEVSELYIDSESYMLVRSVAVRMLQGMESEFTTTMSDYRDVGGLLFPFAIDIDTPQGRQSLTFDEVEIGVDVDESVFSMEADGS